jgi:hypothetical protein
VTTAERLPAAKLPVPVLDYPHWRVTYRPATYDEKRIRTLSECLDVVSKNRVRLRGWDFPHLSQRPNQITYGPHWIAAWSDFNTHLEYWRLYQSTQFLYLGVLREVLDKESVETLKSNQLLIDKEDISKAPGFLSITNFVFNVTEMFEFAARLAQASFYLEPVEMAIRLADVQGFVLIQSGNRLLRDVYRASVPELTYLKTLTPAELVASASDAAIECILWFFERFGWLNPSVDAIRSDQQTLLKGRF